MRHHIWRDFLHQNLHDLSEVLVSFVELGLHILVESSLVKTRVVSRDHVLKSSDFLLSLACLLSILKLYNLSLKVVNSIPCCLVIIVKFLSLTRSLSLVNKLLCHVGTIHSLSDWVSDWLRWSNALL